MQAQSLTRPVVCAVCKFIESPLGLVRVGSFHLIRIHHFYVLSKPFIGLLASYRSMISCY